DDSEVREADQGAAAEGRGKEIAMPSVPVLDAKGKKAATLEIRPDVFGVEIRSPLLHQAVTRELADRRAGTHDTKGRSEVSGGGRKPWKQKGTGRARQGSIRAPQWKGGGKPFGPTPRSYAQDLPRAMSRPARMILIRPLMTEKSMRQKEEQNTVAFRVRPDANKVEIRLAVEEVFNVKVASVRTASFEGKLKRMGRFQGRRPDWKKAIVTLQPGHKIELVEGA